MHKPHPAYRMTVSLELRPGTFLHTHSLRDPVSDKPASRSTSHTVPLLPKPLPTTVTTAPPIVGPVVGLTDRTLGGRISTWKSYMGAFTAWRPATVTLTGPAGEGGIKRVQP
jgi:hypothetical protein